MSAVTWLKYCRYGVKQFPINQPNICFRELSKPEWQMTASRDIKYTSVSGNYGIIKNRFVIYLPYMTIYLMESLFFWWLWEWNEVLCITCILFRLTWMFLYGVRKSKVPFKRSFTTRDTKRRLLRAFESIKKGKKRKNVLNIMRNWKVLSKSLCSIAYSTFDAEERFRKYFVYDLYLSSFKRS